MTCAPIGTKPPAATNDALVFALPPATSQALPGSGPTTGLWKFAAGSGAVGPWQVRQAVSGCGPATWLHGTGLPSAPITRLLTPGELWIWQTAAAEPVNDT